MSMLSTFFDVWRSHVDLERIERRGDKRDTGNFTDKIESRTPRL